MLTVKNIHLLFFCHTTIIRGRVIADRLVVLRFVIFFSGENEKEKIAYTSALAKRNRTHYDQIEI